MHKVLPVLMMAALVTACGDTEYGDNNTDMPADEGEADTATNAIVGFTHDGYFRLRVYGDGLHCNNRSDFEGATDFRSTGEVDLSGGLRLEVGVNATGMLCTHWNNTICDVGVEGHVLFDQLEVGGPATGTYRLLLEDNGLDSQRELEGDFDAVWCG